VCYCINGYTKRIKKMAYVLQRTDSLSEALRGVALEQIDIAINAVEDPACPAASRAHGVRRCCKRLRGLLRLVEPGLKPNLKREEKFVRTAAGRLARHRDARVMLETHQNILAGLSMDDTDELALLTNRLQQAVVDAERGDTFLQALEEAATDLEIVWQRAASWHLKDQARKIISKGYALTYQRALIGQQDAFTKYDARSFHRWRAQVKYHHMHAYLLQSVWPLTLAARAQAAGELADNLGDANDLTVYADSLICSGSAPELVNVLIDNALEKRNQLWTDAQNLGERLFHQPAKVVGKDMAKLWRLSQPTATEAGVKPPASP
jgi:CHAD domain-containing protein